MRGGATAPPPGLQKLQMSTRELLPWQHEVETNTAFSIDRYCNTVTMQSGWATLTGWAPEEITGKPFADAFHPADRPALLEALQSIIRAETYSCRVPARASRRDGMHCWVEIYAHPTLDEDGRIEGLRGTLSDITNRRKGMQALRESEARFRAICEASPLGVHVTDANGHCIFANANLEQMSGLRADQLRGNGYLTSVHLEDRARLLDARDTARRSLTPYRLEHRYVHPDGSETWSRLNGAPIVDNGNLLGYVHVSEDVTAQRSADEALRLSQERLQLALEGSGDALLDWDLASGELYLSEQWGAMIGGPQTPAVTTTRDLLELIDPCERPVVERALEETLRGERPFLRTQCRVRTQSGELKWIEAHAKVMRRAADGRPLRLTGTCADITDRKDFETRQAEFMATVSHELRTPLASVLGALEVLREEYRDELPDGSRRFLDMALRNGNQLASLINSVLDLERIETGLHAFKFAPVRVSELLARAIEVNEPYAMKLAVRLQLDPPAAEVYAWTDPVRALQILTNLISNAVKFSPEGSAVRLGCECAPERVRLFVEDHGPGIPEESRDRIFHRFGQAANQEHSRLPGSGLGLSICRALASRLGGDIGYRTELGNGSMFWVDLPRSNSQAAETATA
jgi:PAS domain S-box-containing protein